MTVTECVVLKLKQESSNDALKDNSTYTQCMRAVTQSPGCKGLTWGVTVEDATMLVWLVEWEKKEDHTEGFMKSGVYAPFKEDLLSLTEIKSLDHFSLGPVSSPPALNSSERGMLEVLLVSLKSGETHDDNFAAIKPISDGWEKEGRPFATSPCLDEEAKQKLLVLVPWKSVDEHMESTKQEHFAKALGEAKPKWDIQLYSHIQPQLVKK